jgi:protein involved in polysaccharide export with SLBB domain
MMRMQNSPKHLKIRLRRVFAFCAVALFIGGCVIPRERAVVNETPPLEINRVTEHFPSSLYRLAEGDVLEVLYLPTPTISDAPYRLQIKDQIDIEFAFHPEMNRTVRVRPDGKISIPRKDDVKVAGLTADETRNILKKVYSDLLKDPDITVTVRDFNVRLDEMQRTFASAALGQARAVSIRPDGHISLPLIPDMPAANLTVPDLTQLVNKRYAGILPDTNVSVILREVVGNIVFVDGEVNRPGAFTVRGPTTVQHAVALAGGTRPTAENRTILVVSKGPDGKFISRTTDLSKMTSASDFMVGRNDLIFVPRSTIARADLWVDQNIRQLLMFTGWSLGVSADLGRVSTTR